MKSQAKDTNDQIISIDDRVKPVGNCQKTKETHLIAFPMIDMIKRGEYYKIDGIPRKTLIRFGGFNWHPSDVEIELKIITTPMKPEKFNVNNLDI